MLTDDEVKYLLSSFPEVEFAFAYGSGVVQQSGYDYSKKNSMPMVDLIFVVKDSEKWHEQNMNLNPNHYSSLLPMGPSLVSLFQESLQAHFWFNAYVKMDEIQFPGRLLKYGVISQEHFILDMVHWNNMYVAGRLHKPVHIIKDNPYMHSYLGINHEQAVRAALLLLPNKFTRVELFQTIASLSYIGDPRMIIGENPKKIVNLVKPVVPHYQLIYEPILRKFHHVRQSTVVENLYLQEKTLPVQWDSCLLLPKTLRHSLLIRSRERVMGKRPPRATTIRTALASIVASAATMQTMKGLFTVGVFKSVSYVAAKLAKQFKVSA